MTAEGVHIFHRRRIPLVDLALERDGWQATRHYLQTEFAYARPWLSNTERLSRLVGSGAGAVT